MKSKTFIRSIYGITGILLLLTVFIFFKDTFYQKSSIPPVVLLRCDDIGMSKSVNEAVEKLAAMKIPISASVIVNSSYYNEAIEMLKRHPEISVGVHLAFTSEWENDRWKPLLPAEKVKSLVDSNGYFLPSRFSLINANPDTLEIEAEAEAQIQKILKSGIKVDFIDSHMYFLYSSICGKMLRRLGEKYNLLVSRMNNELLIDDLYKVDGENKTSKYIDILSSLNNGETYIIVLHIASYPEELNSMRDLNKPLFTKSGESYYREFQAVISKEASQLINKRNISLITYSNFFGRSKSEEN